MESCCLMGTQSFCFVLLLLFFGSAGSLWDLSSLTRDQTQATAVKVPSPNHWTTRELPGYTVSVGEVEKFLEVGGGDGCTKM